MKCVRDTFLAELQRKATNLEELDGRSHPRRRNFAESHAGLSQLSREDPKTSMELCAELSEVMVEVFVYESGPLLRLEGAEEGMGVLGAAGGAPVYEVVDGREELGALVLDVVRCEVCGEEFRGRG